MALVRGDAEELEPTSLFLKKQLVRVARFLGINPRSKKPRVDTILLSDILNYTDYRLVIPPLSRYLKRGGRIVIMNNPRYAIPELLSDRRAMDYAEIVSFLRKEGYVIEQNGEIIVARRR